MQSLQMTSARASSLAAPGTAHRDGRAAQGSLLPIPRLPSAAQPGEWQKCTHTAVTGLVLQVSACGATHGTSNHPRLRTAVKARVTSRDSWPCGLGLAQAGSLAQG